MAMAKICDRCCGVYSKNTHTVKVDDQLCGHVKGSMIIFEEASRYGEYCDSTTSNSRRSKNAYFDLCPTCAKEFTDFMNAKMVLSVEE